MNEERKKIVDQAGALAAELAPMKAKEKALNALKATIRTWPEEDSIAAEAGAAYRGAKHVAMVTPKENKRSFRSMRRLAKFLGTIFWQKCSFSVTEWDKLDLPNKPTDLLVEERTGSRSVEFAPIAK